MAVIYFKKQKVDYAVFEVGLGGRFDATNFGNFLIPVITRISLDHTHILGESVEKVAWEKCGIIHDSQTVITTSANKDVMQVIEDVVRKNNSELIVSEGTSFEVSLKGDFQKENAGIAETVLIMLGVSDEVIQQAFLEVKWPGRLEFVEKNVLIDCAHNTAGVKALGEYVNTLDYEKLFVVFGVSSNKNYREMLKLLPKYDELIFTQSSVETRSLKLEDVPDDLKCTKIEDVGEAVSYAKSKAGENDLVLVCGSIFLVGDVKGIKHPNRHK